MFYAGIKRTVAAAILGATLVAAAPASAATIHVSTVGSNPFANAAGRSQWYVNTTFVALGHTVRTAAGVFRLKGTDSSGHMSQFLAFCLSPLETLRLPLDYQVGSRFSEAVNRNLFALASNAFSLVNNSRSAAAFQMAAWEIVTETAPVFDIGRGDFRVTGASVGSINAARLAQSWLGNINSKSWTASADYTILMASRTQDLLTNQISPVPVPAAGWLLLAGMLGLVGYGRRRSKVAVG